MSKQVQVAFCKALFLLCHILVLSSLQAQTIYYVKTSGSDANNGSSWNAAFKTVQQALTVAGTNTQVWVAKGTYYPDEGGGKANNDRSAAFGMKNSLALFGGFAGTEAQLNQRDWKANVTILSGDIDQNDATSGATFNSIHVVKNDNNGLNNTAVLDGFTITGAYALGDDYYDHLGGGMYNNQSSPALANVTFSNNTALSFGGGMYNESCLPTLNNCTFSGNVVLNNFDGKGSGMCNFSSSAVLTNCNFSGNRGTMGGGLFNSASSTVLTNCSFLGNIASEGGGVYNESSSAPTLTNCIFSGNKATGSGSAVYNSNASPTFINCSFGGNNALISGTLYNAVTSPTVTNCIFWGDGGGEISGSNAIVTYSLVQGGYAGTGNLDGTDAATDPLFVQQPAYSDAPTNVGNLRLQRCSPVINKGNNAGNNTTLDLDGNTRKFGTIDMGAYEYQAVPFGTIVYVNGNLLGGANNGTSWTDAYTKLQDALSFAATCSSVKQIWVAQGTYYPDEGGGKTDNDSAAAFVMNKGQAIYGGFLGVETVLTQRDAKRNVTVLSGDITQNGGTFATNGNNSYHVIYNNNNALTNTALIDGFTITAANSRRPELPDNGTNGGGMYNYQSSPSVTNCVFTGNMTTFGWGAGMYNYASSPAIKNCIFSGNRAGSDNGTGGGLANYYKSSPVITNCIFSGNYASLGGGIYNFSAGTTITNCTFAGNLATSLQGCALADYGGATVNNSIFYGNGPSDNFENSITEISGEPSINYSFVRGRYPSGIGNVDATNTYLVPFFASMPDYNQAPTTAGDLHVIARGSLTIDNGNNAANSTSTDLDGYLRKINTIDLGAYERPNILRVKASATGANNGSSWTNAFTSLQDALAVSKNTGSVQIWVAKGTYLPSKDSSGNTPANPRDKTFTLLNNAEIYGGFPDVADLNDFDMSKRNWQVYETILSGNGTSYHVIYNSNIFSPAVLDGFTIQAGKADGTGFSAYGGGMLNISSSPTIANCKFAGNNGGNGAAMFNYSGSRQSNPRIRSCNFTNNVSQYGGGGIYNNVCAPLITGSTFSYNGVSGGFGGGILNDRSSPTIKDCNFSWNQASAVYNSASSATITDCYFSNNYSNSGGGALLNESSSTKVTNCSFSVNSAGNGGAIYNKAASTGTFAYCGFDGNLSSGNGGAMYNESSSPVLRYCNFRGSQAVKGGAIFNVSSSPRVSNCFLDSNVVSSAGGGMYNENSSSPQLTNCSIAGNRAGTSGGGISSDLSSPVLINCVLAGNKVTTGNGGAMYSNGGSSVLANCSFAGNNATSGGALYNNASSATVTNSILWGDGGTTEIGGANAVVTNSIIQGGYSGGGNLNQDPMFSVQVNYANAPTTANDLRLKSCSPGINTGSESDGTNTSTEDMDGNSRKVSIIDKGAYEYPGPFSLATDYFRSAGTGNWNSACSWQSSANNIDWYNATRSPELGTSGVIIQNGHVVTVTQNVGVKKLTVNSGGKLNVASGVVLTTQ